MRHSLPKGIIQHARTRTTLAWAKFGIFAFLLLVGVAAIQFTFFLNYHYDRALPNVTINGQNMHGMTRAEMVSYLTQRGAQPVTFTVDTHEKVVSLHQTGLQIDVPATVDEVLSYSQSPFNALGTIFQPQDVPLRFTYDQPAFYDFARSLGELTGKAPQDASITLNEAGDGFVIRPAVPGQGVPSQDLRAVLEQTVRDGGEEAVALTSQQMDAEITTAEAEQAQSAAQALVGTSYAVAAPRETVVASVAEKASWVAFEPADDGHLTARFDTEKAEQWMKAVLDSANREPIAAIHHVDADGNMLEVGRPAKTGVQITNAEAATQQFMDAVRNGQETEVALQHVEVPAGVENRVKPAGPERFPYQPKGNEKWVDVNLTYSTLTAYEGYTPVYGPILINHGGVGHETITGTYHVYLKYDKQDMGCTPDWPYCEKDVPSVSYWHKDYALHGAPWVKEFGIGTDESSHGCINIPVPDAKWIHGFTEIGTTVVTHYEP